nr:protein rep [Evansella caseinilytica]
MKVFSLALGGTKNRDPENKSFGTYHPHFHVLRCVPSNYFSKVITITA